MILAIDIGNSNIVLGCIEGEEIGPIARLASDPDKTEHEYAVTMRDVLSLTGTDLHELEGAIISSVVSSLTETMRRAVELLTGKAPLVVGKGLKTGLDIRIDDPAQLGADLLVGAVAALHSYEPPFIIVDMGTATTLFAVDASARFVGGVILPGLRLSLNALASGTSQLPHISPDAPKKVIGTNTVACMQSGAIYGTAATIDGLIDRMEAELGTPVQVIATGGLVDRILPYCRREMHNEPLLLLKGLAVLWEKNRRNRS